MITVVGLGCTDSDLTLRGLKKINGAKKVYARTVRTKAGKALQELRPDVISFDNLYEEASNFDELKSLIKKELKKEQNCVFCVDGAGGDDPVVVELAKTESIDIISGVSLTSNALAIYPDVSIQVKNATDIVEQDFMISADSTLVIKEIDDKLLASELKLKLLDAYGDISCFFVRSGIPHTVDICDLDRQRRYDYSCYVILPQKSFLDKKRFNTADLYTIIYALVAPNGCPWDKVQTHESIRDCCIEEAYELVEAINVDNIDKMVEETGDVLLQGFFHSNIAERQGEYTINDVLSGVCNKLIHRHLHIFAGVKADTPEEALDVWEKAKAMEKSQHSFTEKMEQVAVTLPGVSRAGKIQKISKKMGYVLSESELLDKLKKSLEAFENDKTEENAGELLYNAVALIKYADIDSETALVTFVRKVMNILEAVEKLAKEKGIKLEDKPSKEILNELLNEVIDD